MSDSQGNNKSTPDDATLFERWRQRAAWITGLGLSPEDVKKRDEIATLRRLESDWKTCEKRKHELLHNSPAVTFMVNQLKLINCNVTPEHFQCQPCFRVNSGGFSPEYGILLCQDGFFNKKHMEDTMVHEMIHMYDHAKFKVDWTNLKHQACSESCVRMRAVLSVSSHPECPSREAAEQAVNEVWDSCIKDTRPFDEASGLFLQNRARTQSNVVLRFIKPASPPLGKHVEAVPSPLTKLYLARESRAPTSILYLYQEGYILIVLASKICKQRVSHPHNDLSSVLTFRIRAYKIGVRQVSGETKLKIHTFHAHIPKVRTCFASYTCSTVSTAYPNGDVRNCVINLGPIRTRSSDLSLRLASELSSPLPQERSLKKVKTWQKFVEVVSVEGTVKAIPKGVCAGDLHSPTPRRRLQTQSPSRIPIVGRYKLVPTKAVEHRTQKRVSLYNAGGTIHRTIWAGGGIPQNTDANIMG
ncbi:16588_t:CDS:2 [Acaulospora colombiana]|uniref:16588_t:CDS:1 n=1 Tax=Acaulospora colombiana TaxID=27376 RepID=A0ACA9MQQ1_9GLOM|nr:16588_t:CDS:2 [Acaulospora colombiana]